MDFFKTFVSFTKCFITLNFIFFLHVSPALSQTEPEIKISGDFKNAPLRVFLEEIRNKYAVAFYFNSEWFKDRNISIFLDSVPLSIALEKVFKETPYMFVIIQGRKVAILPKADVAAAIGKVDARTTGLNDLQIIGKPEDIGKIKRPEVKGCVFDGKTSEPIIGATILVKELNTGTATNIKGNFQLNLAPGTYTFVVSSVGYEDKVYNIKLIGNGVFNSELFEKSIKLDEIIVSAQKADRNIRSNQMSFVELDKKAIKQLTSTFGEKDIIKSFTMMPGVKSVGEFGSGINVRGGSSDQNLFLLEGTPVFNTAHVFGLLSIINPDAVNNVTLYKGYIPPAFGERVSSVMDIQLKEGNYNELHTNGGIGLLSSRLMFDGPLIKDKLTFTLGGRSSYSDWLLRQMPDINLRKSSAKFYDFNAMLNYIVNSKNKVFIFAYASDDRFGYGSELNYRYGNYLGSFIWDHNFNTSLKSNLIFAYSNYQVEKDNIADEYKKNRITTGIIYQSLKYNFNLTISSNNTLDFGAQGINYNDNPGDQKPLNNESLIIPHKLNKDVAHEASTYIGDKWDLTDKISIGAGLRYTGYFLVGPNAKYLYEPGSSKSELSVMDTVYFGKGKIIKKYFNIEPRASLKLLLGDKSSVKLSYNRNFQYLTLISYTSISTPDDVWKLSNEYLKPIQCDQYAFGIYRNFRQNSIETSVEFYYKALTNLVDYKNGAQLSMNDKLETALVNAKGKNYGIELLIRKNTGIIDGWISYTYSKSQLIANNIYPEETINGGKYYNSSFDKPHDLTVSANYHFNRRLRFSFSFNYSTGRAVTLPELAYNISTDPLHMSSSNWFVNYSERNKYRLPDYHRLDMSVSLDESLKIKKKWRGSWTFSVINIYARKNPYSIFFEKSSPFSDKETPAYGLYELFIIGQPLPTLTYNFTF